MNLEALKLDRIVTPEFWRQLCPEMSLTETEPLDNPQQDRRGDPVRWTDWETCRATIQKDAYLAYESFFPPSQMDSAANCLRALDKLEIPPVFSFVYDEFWVLPLMLRPLLSDLLGDYLLLPAVWTWIVKTNDQCAFEPHRDWVRETSIDDDNHLDYLTIWIPVNDLDHHSSSISVLPASLDPHYDKATQTVEVTDLQHVRSLQVPRGSVLAWTVQLAHWGTRQSEFGEPRMSVGYYVQKAKAECIESPPIDLTVPFTLRQRLRMIGNQFQMYSRDRSNELIRFASDLVDLPD